MSVNIRNSQTTDKTIVDRTRTLNETSRTVKDMRGRLTSTISMPVAYEFELLTSFARNFVNASLVLPMLVTVIAVVSSAWIGYFVASLWAGTIGLSYILLSLFCKRFLEQAKCDDDLPGWRLRFVVIQLLISLCWMFFAGYGCITCGGNEYGIIQFSSILVVQAATGMLAYSFGSGLLVLAAPASIVLATRFFLTYEPVFVVMGSICCISMIFFYLIANRFKISVLSMLEGNAERESLIGELETARSYSEEARRRAEEANLAKSRFLATMSHELRTPLNAILGFSEVIKNEVLGPVGSDTYKEYAGDIHESGTHLLHLINEILDISRIEAGKHDLHEEAVRLVHVVENACHMIDIKAKSKGVTITTRFEFDLPQLWADERALRQITLNLLSNALKFTPSGGSIDIKVGWTRLGSQYLSIKDTGPGIPEDEIPIVLSSFGQGSIAIKSAEQGTGLGLPIVQALVDMHGGKFELKSKLREGTEVIATFPKSRVLEVMEPIKDENHAVNHPRENRKIGA
ncbi:MAG: HAMP domain-containing sensor histidine kinase [Rhizobiaceae bacterium]